MTVSITIRRKETNAQPITQRGKRGFENGLWLPENPVTLNRWRAGFCLWASLVVKGKSIKDLTYPLMGDPLMDLSSIDWVIVGGESGPSVRSIAEEWVLNIQQQCRKANVSFFFKQWGGVNKKKSGRLLRGRVYNELPNLTNAMCPA